MLVCPKCGKQLVREGQSYRCERGHCYDVARQGYTNLLIRKQKESGDNAGMVKARSSFLEAGYYACLREALKQIIDALSPACIVDAGCGEGYYTSALIREGRTVYAFDLSKHALMKCARRSNDLHCFAASCFALPLSDHCADLITSLFAPFAQEEFARVLRAGGHVLKVEPGRRHLYELKELLYDRVIENEAEAVRYPSFALEKEWLIEDVIEVRGAEHIEALFQMTPYYYRSPREGARRLRACASLRTTIQFHVELYGRSCG